MKAIIERHGRSVHVLPVPSRDERTAAEIKKAFRQEDGWSHFRYGVNRICASRMLAAGFAGAAREVLQSKGLTV